MDLATAPVEAMMLPSWRKLGHINRVMGEPDFKNWFCRAVKHRTYLFTLTTCGMIYCRRISGGLPYELRGDLP